MLILLVEDNEVNRMVVSGILNKMGYSNDSAENGGEALERAQESKYDLIFMDVEMPGMDGLEAARRLRGQPDLYGMPHIVALTARAAEEDRRLCLESGMDDYISKPVSLQIIIEKLQEVAKNKFSTETSS